MSSTSDHTALASAMAIWYLRCTLFSEFSARVKTSTSTITDAMAICQ
jgi:hypothetical protein